MTVVVAVVGVGVGCHCPIGYRPQFSSDWDENLDTICISKLSRGETQQIVTLTVAKVVFPFIFGPDNTG